MPIGLMMINHRIMALAFLKGFLYNQINLKTIFYERISK